MIATALTVAFVVGMLTLPALALDAWDRRKAARAFARHVEQAVNVIDDGRALVGEVEEYLRRRLRP